MRTLMRTLTSTLFIAAAAGFAFAHYGGSKRVASPAPLTRQATAKNFTVRYPATWRVTTVHAVPDLPLVGSVTLAPVPTAGAELVIGTAPQAHPARTAHLANQSVLPPSLVAALSAKPAPQVVTLGGTDFYRYLNLTPIGRGATESIYLLPTTLGTITAVCSAAHPTTSFTSTCERILATLKVTLGRVNSLTVDAGYALELNRILAQLNATRAAATKGLRSGDVHVRARAADDVAAADERAALAAHHITGVEVNLENPALEVALRMNARAYSALEQAALKGDTGGYQRAEAAIDRSVQALNAVYAKLRAFGYQVG